MHTMNLQEMLFVTCLYALCCVGSANAGLYVYVGDIECTAPAFDESAEEFIPPTTNFWIYACLDPEIHDVIMKEIDVLPWHHSEEFISMYGLPLCYLWVVDGDTRQVIAWYSVNTHDFSAYVCSQQLHVIFPDTKLCIECGSRIENTLKMPRLDMQLECLPDNFQIARGARRGKMIKRFLNGWETIQSQGAEAVSWWRKEHCPILE